MLSSHLLARSRYEQAAIAVYSGSTEASRAVAAEIAALVEGLLADIGSTPTTFDAIADLAYPLPVAVICRLLGFTDAPLDTFRRYAALYAREQAYCHFSPALISNLEQYWNAANRRA